MIEGRRSPTGLLMLGVVAAIAAGVILSRMLDTEPKAREELRDRLRASESGAAFWFSYRRGGTRVLDCFTPNLRFAGEVDPRSQQMVVSVEGRDEPAALVDDGTVLVHESLFSDPPFSTAWLRVDRPLDAARTAALRRALGTDLLGDILSDRVPQPGHDIAAAALRIAQSVERLPPGTATAGARTDIYRIEVDRDEFSQIGTDVPTTSWAESTPETSERTPVFRVWIDSEDAVVRLEVLPEREGGRPAPPENGWVVDYRGIQGVTLPAIDAADITSSADLEVSGLAPARRPCRLPS